MAFQLSLELLKQFSFHFSNFSKKVGIIVLICITGYLSEKLHYMSYLNPVLKDERKSHKTLLKPSSPGVLFSLNKSKIFFSLKCQVIFK